jgi:short-subunit dehydrogenase
MATPSLPESASLAVVTGASSGIGYEPARIAASRGLNLVIGGRRVAEPGSGAAKR